MDTDLYDCVKALRMWFSIKGDKSEQEHRAVTDDLGRSLEVLISRLEADDQLSSVNQVHENYTYISNAAHTTTLPHAI